MASAYEQHRSDWEAQPRRISRVAVLALGVALAGIAGLALAGLGTRWGWWSFRFGFSVLRWGFYLVCAALPLGIAGAVLARPGAGRRGFLAALLAILVGGLGVYVMLRWVARARAVPAIHDITTDTQDPPRFVAVLPLRRGAANAAEYEGAAVAAEQARAYPELRPLDTRLPPQQVFPAALAAAREMAWTIDAEVPAEGRIEATATTFWFGFKDDIVIRIRALGSGSGSRVDVRSVSRVGKSDVGTNARRVSRYLELLREKL